MTSKRRVRALASRTLALVAVAGLVVSACGGASDSAAPESAGTDPAAGAVADPAPEAPGDAPDLLRFTSPLVGGGELDAAELAGTPTAFWFWSPT